MLSARRDSRPENSARIFAHVTSLSHVRRIMRLFKIEISEDAQLDSEKQSAAAGAKKKNKKKKKI